MKYVIFQYTIIYCELSLVKWENIQKFILPESGDNKIF